MPLFNERQQSFHAKNCCCCGLYVRRQRVAPQTISLAGQSFWGWPPRGYDEGELLLLPCIAALPENSHEFEKSWLLFVCVSLFFCSCIDKRWTVLNEICQLRTYYLTIRTDMLVPSSDTSTLLCLPWCSCLKNPAIAAPLHECCVIFMQLTEALLKHKRLTHVAQFFFIEDFQRQGWLTKKYASRVWLRKGLKSTAWKWHYLFLLYLGMPLSMTGITFTNYPLQPGFQKALPYE